MNLSEIMKNSLLLGLIAATNNTQASKAKTIYSALVKFVKDKNIQINKLVSKGFDGATTFSGKHNGVQSLLKKNSPATVSHLH